MDVENESMMEETLLEADVDGDGDLEHDTDDVDAENDCEDAGNGSNEDPEDAPEHDSNFVFKRLLRRQAGQSKEHCAKEERNATIKKVTCILQKAESERTSDEQLVLKACAEIVKEVQSRRKKRDEAKRRQEEFEEPFETLKAKCNILAQAIAQSQHLVIYTGAGISTAARIPDYRGTNGIWTMLQQGKSIGNHDLSLAEPTYTHMALSELYKRNILKYVVSQNCDGLHLRSGLPRTALSEVHGNMYVEVCKTCKPSREYWRLFDVTENTARYSHKTMRKCYVCNGALNDSIVHFGERGSLLWPLNWSGASKNSRKATTIVCLGSSLKVLKKYPWLWQMHKPVKRRPNLYIVNLQWTPKDDCANVKIHGKCDLVMKTVMDLLGIQVPQYDREKDPIFVHGTHLLEQEYHTTTQPFLKFCGKKVPGKTAQEIIERAEVIRAETTKKIEAERIKNEKLEVKVEDVDCNVSQENGCQTEHNLEKQADEQLVKVEKQENIDDDDDKPINYSKHPTSTSDCDTISNIYSIDKVPLTPTPCKTIESSASANGGLPCYATPQAAHSNNSSNSATKATTLKSPNNGLNLNVNTNLNMNSNLNMNTNMNMLQYAQNCQALLTYYQLSNTLLQSSLGLQAYRDMLYPLQTSLLYSGLHSIINPMPFLTEDNSNSTRHQLSNNHRTQAIIKEEDPEPTCDYCYENYKSFTCVFYEKLEPGFAKQQSRYSKTENCQKPLYCLCCDYSTEEEDEENVEGVPPDKISKLQEVQDGEQKEKAKIQPGWYGKGYRKNKKNRKKPSGQY